MAEENLRECPFCGGANLMVFGDSQRWVACKQNGCSCEGPTCPSEDEAIAAWNTRVPLTVPADVAYAARVAARNTPLTGESVKACYVALQAEKMAAWILGMCGKGEGE